MQDNLYFRVCGVTSTLASVQRGGAPAKYNQEVYKCVGEPAEYVLHRWTDCQKSEKRFIKEYELLQGRIGSVQTRRSEKSKRKLHAISQDDLTQQAEEDEDEPWSRRGSVVEVDTSLRNDLLSILEKEGLDKSMKRAHSHVACC